MPIDVLVYNALNLEERQTYGFKVARLKWGGRVGDVTDRQAVGCKDGRPEGRAEERTDKLSHRERNIQKDKETERVGVGDTRPYVVYMKT